VWVFWLAPLLAFWLLVSMLESNCKKVVLWVLEEFPSLAKEDFEPTTQKLQTAEFATTC
jgi:hypothetical protein